MSDSTAIFSFSTALAAAAVSCGMGFLAYLANPERSVNRAFGLVSLVVAAWLVSLEVYLAGGAVRLTWLRLASMFGAYVPAMIWILKECIHNGDSVSRNLRRGWPWLTVCTLLAIDSWSDWYISDVVRTDEYQYGFGFYSFIAASLILYPIVGIQGMRQALRSMGQVRLELMVFALCLTGGGSVILVFMLLAIVLQDNAYLHLQPIVVLLVYGFTAWMITSYRILSAHQILAHALHRIILTSVVALLTYLLHRWTVHWLPSDMAWLCIVAAGLAVGIELNRRLQVYFGLVKLEVPQVRQSLREVARLELEPARLKESYLAVLRHWSGADRTVAFEVDLVADSSERLSLAEDGPEVRGLRRLRWVTPESLRRRRKDGESESLQCLMDTHNLGALVLAHGVSMSIVLGLGYPPRHRPYPHSQMADISEMAAIIVNGLERARASWNARRAEQLATVGVIGASVAHEIRNPLVAIKTFVQLLPEKYDDPVFREKIVRILGPEVDRIDQLVQHLLDLSSPRGFVVEPVDLNTAVRAVLALLADKATARGVTFELNLGANPGVVASDRGVIRQVVLNLCLNAFHALENKAPPRTVFVSTHQLPVAVELCLQDNGPGISDAIRAHLFEPFTTNKSTGIGLGLALSRNLLAGVHATIVADPPTAGRGASFRMTFPKAEVPAESRSVANPKI